MLKLRHATVLEIDAEPGAPEQKIQVRLKGESSARPAIVDVGLLGAAEVDDEVIVNTQALDLGLGSGGFDVVHVNLTRGLQGGGEPGSSVMKLNYTSLQHAVSPVEDAALQVPIERPAAVLAVHGQLAAVAWAFAEALPGARLGYVQTAGGALAGSHSETVRALREQGMLAGHLTAGAAFGGEGEAITAAGAMHHGLRTLGWDAAVVRPRAGDHRLRHRPRARRDGGAGLRPCGARARLLRRCSWPGCPRAMSESATAGSPTTPSRSSTCCSSRSPSRCPPACALPSAPSCARDSGTCSPAPRAGRARRSTSSGPCASPVTTGARRGSTCPHTAASGLPAVSMGRTLMQDPLFFGAALAGGTVLAELVADRAERAEVR